MHRHFSVRKAQKPFSLLALRWPRTFQHPGPGTEDSLAVAPHDSHTLEVTLGLANPCGSWPGHLRPHF